MPSFLDTLRQRVVVFDGATGTNLQARDLGPEDFGGATLEGRNEMLVLDPLTGDVLWRRRGILPHTTVKGNDQTVFVMPPNGSEPYALRAADGRSVPAQDLAARTRNAVAVTHSGFVRVDRKTGGRIQGSASSRLKIFVEDPLTGDSAWKSACM